ncbi:MAG: inorganic diphosphatase [bacterium]|nr:inorganic diphosphatase [bacterium]
MSLKNVPFGSPEKFNVIIEIAQGSQDKYEYDEELDVIKLDRVLYTSQRFPANYGFIPETRADDGDHTDVLLFSTNPIFPGAVVEARAIGFMNMNDSGEIDNKILAVPTEDPRFSHVQSLAELPEHSPKEIKNFFETYKILQNKQVTVGEFESKEKALEYISTTREVYTNEHKA